MLLRFESDLDPRLIELAIVTIAARWRSEFEWWAHSRRASSTESPAEILDAIRRVVPCRFNQERNLLSIPLQRNLTCQGFLDAVTYAAGIDLLGVPGMVGLTVLCGYYSTVAFTLNAFRVPLPPEVQPMWSD